MDQTRLMETQPAAEPLNRLERARLAYRQSARRHSDRRPSKRAARQLLAAFLDRNKIAKNGGSR